MAIASKVHRFAGPLIPALIGIFISASPAPAQTKQILTWQEDLTYLQNAAADELAQAQARVKNLFDRDYYCTAGFPEAGRNWYFNLRYRF